MMWYLARLEMRSFIPGTLWRGMYFISTDQQRIISLDTIPQDEEAFIAEWGYPVRPYIVDATSPQVLASYEVIGWLQDDSEYLSDITAEHLQTIMFDYEGNCYIGVDDDVEEIEPFLEEGRVVLCF